MSEKEISKADAMWVKLDDELIYKFKAVNTGQFNGGRYYDFYQKKEADAAADMLTEKHSEMFDKVSIINIDHEFTDFWRVTIINKQ